MNSSEYRTVFIVCGTIVCLIVGGILAIPKSDPAEAEKFRTECNARGVGFNVLYQLLKNTHDTESGKAYMESHKAEWIAHPIDAEGARLLLDCFVDDWAKSKFALYMAPYLAGATTQPNAANAEPE